MTDAPLLAIGASGAAVRDLQHRLVGTGQTIAAGSFGTFDHATEAAVRAFQETRGILVDGVVGSETWSALVESGFVLGDRLLALRRPNLRGDDVVELQQTLNRLGFDAGREDGILGPDTSTALRDFQRNSGLSVDGIAGPATLDAFRRVQRMAAGSVAAVRERDELRRPAELIGRRIYLAVAPGYDQVGAAVRQGLDQSGAQVMPDLSGADDHALAGRANRWPADLFIAIRRRDEPGWETRFFESGNFRSERGHHAAELIAAEIGAVFGDDGASAPVGCAYSVLRETRMAAVLCGFGHGAAETARVSGLAAELGAGISRGIRRTFEEAKSFEGAGPGEVADTPGD